MKVVNTKTIALFGGRFDPVHNGHLAVAKEVLKMKAADEVWFSLENQHQWRPIVASVADRKAMLELGIEEEVKLYSSRESGGRIEKFSTHVVRSNNKLLPDSGKNWIPDRVGNDSLKGKFKLDMTPIEIGGLTETIGVMRVLYKKYPDHKFIFVCGSDQLPTFSKWSHWEELQKEVHFLIVARKGSPLVNIPPNATVIDDPTYEPLEDSATRIRELRKAGKAISGLVPKVVEKYIIEHGLYQ